MQARARAALAERLQGLGRAGGTHATRLEDALVGSLGAADVAWVQGEIAARAKGELRPTRAGNVPLHAAWSSAALVGSAFAPWRERPGALRLPGLDGPFTDVRLEERLAIPHGGGSPNLDVALESAGGLVGIEAKLTEHLAGGRPRPWKPAYRRPAMAEELTGGWRTLFDALLDGTWEPRYLDAGQLVRHALSLRGAGALALVYWEPPNAEEHAEALAHRAEVREMLERVGDAAPRLHALSWSAVWTAWEPAAPEHVAALRERYAVEVERP